MCKVHALLVVVVGHVEDVAELVSDGAGSAAAVVLDNGAAVLIAHRSQLGQSQSIAVLRRRIRISANVFAGQQQSHVVLAIVVTVDVGLPFTKYF